MQIRRIATWFVVVTGCALFGSSFRGESGTTLHSCILRLKPDTGKRGDIITAYGEQLDQPRVAALLLTNGEYTAMVRIVEQNEVSIRFRIPVKLSSGRYRVVILPTGRYSRGIEQQVTLTVCE